MNRYLSFIYDKLHHYIKEYRLKINNYVARLVDPRKKIIDHRLKLDDHSGRLYRAVTNLLRGYQDQFGWQQEKLTYNSPGRSVDKFREKLERIADNLNKHCQTTISEKQTRLRECIAKLNGLNPTAILSRGYSITRTLPELSIVRDAVAVSVDQKLEIILAKGSISCDVKERFKNGKKIV